MKKSLILAALLSLFSVVASADCLDSGRWNGEEVGSAEIVGSEDFLYLAHQEVLRLSGSAAETRRRTFLRQSVSKVVSLGLENVAEVTRGLRAGNAQPLRDALSSIEMTAKSNEILSQLYWVHGCPIEALNRLEQGLESRQRIASWEYALPLAVGDADLLDTLIVLDSGSDYFEERTNLLIALLRGSEDASKSLAAFRRTLVETAKETSEGFAKDLYGVFMASQYLAGEDLHTDIVLNDLHRFSDIQALSAMAAIPIWLSVVGACDETMWFSELLLPDKSIDTIFARNDVEAATLRCLSLQRQ